MSKDETQVQETQTQKKPSRKQKEVRVKVTKEVYNKIVNYTQGYHGMMAHFLRKSIEFYMDYLESNNITFLEDILSKAKNNYDN